MALLGNGVNAKAFGRLCVLLGCRLTDVNEFCLVRSDVEAVQPLQGLLDVFHLKTDGAEFASQEMQLGARITAPVVFVNKHEYFKHCPQYTWFLRRWAKSLK